MTPVTQFVFLRVWGMGGVYVHVCDMCVRMCASFLHVCACVVPTCVRTRACVCSGVISVEEVQKAVSCLRDQLNPDELNTLLCKLGAAAQGHDIKVRACAPVHA